MTTATARSARNPLHDLTPIVFPSREEFGRIVSEINAAASQLRAVRRLQAAAPLTERHRLRSEAQALEDRIGALYERKRVWHAAHELARYLAWKRQRRRGTDTLLTFATENDSQNGSHA